MNLLDLVDSRSTLRIIRINLWLDSLYNFINLLVNHLALVDTCVDIPTQLVVLLIKSNCLKSLLIVILLVHIISICDSLYLTV